MGNLNESIASFFKVMIDDDYSRVLYLPPKFARTVPHLLRKEIHLENLAGQRWSVVVSKENGYLAFRKGWSEFSVAHNLEIGDFLVFHYFSGPKFLVQIFNRSGCDVRGLGWDQGSPCRRRRRRKNDLNPVDTSPGKEDSNASLYSADVGNVCVHEGKSAAKVPPLAVGNNPMVKAEPANFEDPELQFLMVGRDMYTGQGEDRTVIDLSNYEMPNADAKRTRHLTETGCSLLYADNFVKSKPEPELTGVANHEQEKKPHFGFPESTKAKEIERSIYSDVKQKINNASTLGSPSLPDFSPLYGPYASKSKAPKKGYQAGKSDSPLQSGGSSVKIKKEIKTEPCEGIGLPLATASASDLVCPIIIASSLHLRLPGSLPLFTSRQGASDSKLVILRDTNDRVWPVHYYHKLNEKILTTGWSEFWKVNKIRVGDECIFKADTDADATYDVRIVRKEDKPA